MSCQLTLLTTAGSTACAASPGVGMIITFTGDAGDLALVTKDISSLQSGTGTIAITKTIAGSLGTIAAEKWRDGGRDGWLDADDPDGSNNRAIRSRRVGDGGPSPPPLGTARLKCADAMRGMGARWRSF